MASTPPSSHADTTRAPLWKAVWNPRMLICVFTGFSSGLPLWYAWQLIPYWLRTQDVSLTGIGLFQMVLIPYSWKFMVAPLVDRYGLSFLGRRRTWMFALHLILAGLIASMGFLDPSVSLWNIAYLGFAIAISSAVLDIAIDAYRRELLPDNELGLGSAIHVNVYRLSSLVSFSLGVYLSQFLSWSTIHVVIGAFMLPGAVFSLLVSEPAIYGEAPKRLYEAVVQPFQEFFRRDGGFGMALAVLAFMLAYKFGDNLALSLITPFYYDMGFSEEQIAFVTKSVSLVANTVGVFAGGLIMFRIGIHKALWIFGFLQLASILGLSVLAQSGNNVWILVAAVSFEYLGMGLGTSAFVAFQQKQANMRFTATQLALFTSLMSIPRGPTGAIAGVLIEGNESWGLPALGYAQFFLFCALMAVPGMVLLFVVAPWFETPDEMPEEEAAEPAASKP